MIWQHSFCLILSMACGTISKQSSATKREGYRFLRTFVYSEPENRRTTKMKPFGNPHLMPIPSNAPWRSESMPWSAPPSMQRSLVEFCGSRNVIPETFYRRNITQHKRKSELVPPLPNKQFISEERMSEHFNGMHISADFISHAANETKDDSNDTSAMEYDLNNPMSYKDLEEKIKNATRITVREELQKLSMPNSDFVPNALINRIEKPCTALVLWQPPPKIHELLSGSLNRESNKNANEPILHDIEEEPCDSENNTVMEMDTDF